jgi:hypothetical protein
MRAIFSTVFLAASTLLLAGCGTLGNWNSIHREFDINQPQGPNDVQSQWVDVKQRGIFLAKDQSGRSPSGSILCAEPSPDALSVYGATVAAEGQSPSGINIGLQSGTQEAGGAFGLRTQSIQLLRDNYYRLCEAYVSGTIGPLAYHVMLQRLQANTIGYLAIEQLTDALGKTQINPTNLSVTGSAPVVTVAPKAKDDGNTKATGTPATTTPPVSGTPAAATKPAKPNPLLIEAAFEADTPAGGAGGGANTPAKPPKTDKPAKSGKKTPKSQTPPKDDPAAKGADTSGDGVYWVSRAVRKIAKDAMDSDQALPTCMTYMADSTATEYWPGRNGAPPAENQNVVNFCKQIVTTAQVKSATAQSIYTSDSRKLAAFDESCTTPDGYKQNVKFCEFLLPNLPHDDLATKAKKAKTEAPASGNGSGTGNANGAAAHPNVQDDEENSQDEAVQHGGNPTL